MLKGAILFTAWMDDPHRPTRDADLLGIGDNSVPALEKTFRGVCGVSVRDDGIAFLPDSVRAAVIREDQTYEGVRIKLLGLLDGARIPVQVDVGFGDAVVPAPRALTLPKLLDFPAPRLKAYSPASVIAEKFETMVKLGIANSRMKDYYDIWVMIHQFRLNKRTLGRAILKTCERRKTTLPTDLPVGLTVEFSNDAQKQTQWRAFLDKGGLTRVPKSLDLVVRNVRDFLWPLLEKRGEV